jgi:hypothetical protein
MSDRGFVKDSVLFPRSPLRVTRRNLRACAGAIKSVIDKSSLVPARKDRLYDKINAFIFELDRERLPLRKFHDVILGDNRRRGRRQSTILKMLRPRTFLAASQHTK